MKSKVSIQPCNTYSLHDVKASLETLVSSFGGFHSHVKRGDLVVLKPNFVFAKPSEQAVTTHPIVIQAVAQMVLDCGATPVIGDSPPIQSASSVAQASGVKKIADDLGVKIVEFNRPTTIRRQEAIYTQGIQSPKIDSFLIDANVIINLPKLKAHKQMLVTGAVKNIFGCVVGRRKPYWHFKLQRGPDDFAAMLLATYEKVAPELTFVDAIVGMERDGPVGGDPKKIGLLVGGEDCVAIDRVLSEIIRVPVEDHFVLRVAERLGFPPTQLNKIQISGTPLEKAKVDSFLLPDLIPIGFSITHLLRGIIKKVLHKSRKDDLAPVS